MRKVGTLKSGIPVAIDTAPAEWGYLLGVMCSDGCLHQYKSRSRGFITDVIAVRLHVRDFELAERFQATIQRVTGIRPTIMSQLVRRVGREDARFYSIHYRNRMLGERLLELGCFGTRDWRVPEVVMSGGIDLQRGFLQGLFDGDGSVRDRTHARTSEPPKLEIGSASQSGLDDLHVLLLSFSISSRIYVMKGKEPFWRLIVTRKQSVMTYWDTIGITLTRKSETFRGSLERYLERVQFQWHTLEIG